MFKTDSVVCTKDLLYETTQTHWFLKADIFIWPNLQKKKISCCSMSIYACIAYGLVTFLLNKSKPSWPLFHATWWSKKEIVAQLKTCGATRNPAFPRTGPKPVRGRGTFLRIFSGRFGSGNFISGRSGSGNFISDQSGSGYCFTGAWDIFSRDFGDKLAFYFPNCGSKMVIILDKNVVWCYNFIAGHIHVFIVVWNLIWSLNIWSQLKLFSIPQNFQVGLDRNLLISGWC